MMNRTVSLVVPIHTGMNQILIIFLDLDVDDTPQKWNSLHGTYSTNDQRGYTNDLFVLGCAYLFPRSTALCLYGTHKSTTSRYGLELDASRNLWEGSVEDG